MASPTHLIERQTFQFKLDKEEDLGIVSRELNLLFEEELSQYMEEILSSLVPAGSYLSIPTLEIDLGTLDIRYFRTSFRSRFREAFASAMAAEIQAYKAKHWADRHLSLLDFFLHKGRNPWWAGRDDTHYDRMLRKALQRRRRPLLQLIRQVASVSIPRKRLILHSTDQTLYGLSELLSPGASGFIRSYLQWIFGAYRKLFRQAPAAADFRSIAWDYLFLYLATHPGTSLDTEYFMKRQLTMLATRFDTPLQGVLKKAAAVPLRSDDAGMRQIKAITAKAAGKAGPVPNPKDKQPEQQELPMLRMLLEKGYSIPREGLPGALQVRINYLTSHALAHLDQDLYQLLMDIGRQSVVRRRMVHYLYADVLRDIFRLLAPQQLETLYAYFELSERVRTRTPARNQEQQSYRQTVRELALKVIIEKMQGQYDNRIFLREQLKAFALHYRIPYRALLELLYADLFALRSKSKALSRLFASVDQLLYSTMALPTNTIPESKPPAGRVTQQNVQSTILAWSAYLRTAGFDMPEWPFTPVPAGAPISTAWLRQLLQQASTHQALALLSAAGQQARSPVQQWLELRLRQLLLPADGMRIQSTAYGQLLDFLEDNRHRFSQHPLRTWLRSMGLPASPNLGMVQQLIHISGLKYPWFNRWLQALEETLTTEGKIKAAELLLSRMVQTDSTPPGPRQWQRETMQQLQAHALLPNTLLIPGSRYPREWPASEADNQHVLSYLLSLAARIRDAGIPIPPLTAATTTANYLNTEWLTEWLVPWTRGNPAPGFALLLWMSSDTSPTAALIRRPLQAALFPKGKKNYTAMLAFIGKYRQQIPAGTAAQWLRKTAVPDDAGRPTIRLQAKALGLDDTLVDSWLAHISGSAPLYRYISVRLAQMAGSREPLPLLMAETARWLQETQGKPAAETLRQWQTAARQAGRDHWLNTLNRAEKQYRRQGSTTIRYPGESPRLTLADLLQLLGMSVPEGQENEQEQLLLTQLYEHTPALVEQLKNLRHRQELIPLLLENLQASEQEVLLQYLLGDGYANWRRDINELQQAQEQLGLFRIPKASFNQQLIAWSLNYYLSPGAAGQSHTFSYYVLEQVQAQGWLDHRRTIRALQQQADAVQLPLALAQQLRELTLQQTVIALRPGAIRRQWLEDLALHLLRYGAMPFWAGPAAEDKPWQTPVVLEALRLRDAGLVQKMAAAAIEGGTLADWHDALTTTARLDVWRLLQPPGAAFNLAQWFEEMTAAEPGFSAALFSLLMQERGWTYRSVAQLVDRLSPALPDRIRRVAARYQEEAAEPDPLIAWLSSGESVDGLRYLELLSDPDFREEMERLYRLIDQHERWEIWVRSMRSRQLFSLLQRYLRTGAGSYPQTALLLQALQHIGANPALMQRVSRIILSGKQGDPGTLESLAAAASSQADRLRAYIEGQAISQALRAAVVRTLEQQGWKTGRPESRYSYEEALLRHYLQFGSLPVATGKGSVATLRAALFTLLEHGGHAFRRQLFAAWKTVGGRQQLLPLLRDEDYPILIKWLHPTLPETLQRLERLMSSTGKGALWPGLSLDTRGARMRYLLDQWTKSRISFIDPEALAQTLFQAYAAAVKTLPGLLLHQAKPQQQADTPLMRILEARQQYSEETTAKATATAAEAATAVPQPGEAWHVYNAGLSLIWPFMGRLFRMLDMVEDKDFRDEPQRMRAVQLMQYIATGRAYNPESDLLLNKIMCGMDIGIPVAPELDISEREEQLVESMMKGVLHNWEKMHGTSIPTFRQSFLQREGRLQWRESFWELIVEKKAYDVLLSTLPWQINMIKYSWMPQPLKVVWA